jgi:hypothetical protein
VKEGRGKRRSEERKQGIKERRKKGNEGRRGRRKRKALKKHFGKEGRQ